MINGAVYKTFEGLKSDREVGLFTPRQKFAPHRFTHWISAGPAVATAPLLCEKIGMGKTVSPSLTAIGLAWTGIYLLYGLFFKPVRDTEMFVEPLRKKCIGENGLGRAVDAFAIIDELLSFHRFAKEFPCATVLPKVADGASHFFEASGLTSPVLARDAPDFVPNDMRMNGSKLTFVSGPNSGGKTTICKSIVQNQLLAQAGSYVAARTASVGIADKIAYQAPKFDGLQDNEGRFGTELARTRDIFFATSPKSLVILDELAEGTTYEERLGTSFGIMNDFYTIGNNTVLVTHNHTLIDQFMEEKKGQALMAEFRREAPTYRIVSGISRVSHAEKIAKKIGFSEEDRLRYLEKKGYL
jgi:DNA mismatch repair ATPase MutS